MLVNLRHKVAILKILSSIYVQKKKSMLKIITLGLNHLISRLVMLLINLAVNQQSLALIKKTWQLSLKILLNQKNAVINSRD